VPNAQAKQPGLTLTIRAAMLTQSGMQAMRVAQAGVPFRCAPTQAIS
jgi:hypothetical protein